MHLRPTTGTIHALNCCTEIECMCLESLHTGQLVHHIAEKKSEMLLIKPKITQTAKNQSAISRNVPNFDKPNSKFILFLWFVERYSYHHETVWTDGKWHCDRAVTLARWQHHAVETGRVLLCLVGWLVVWHSGRTLVFDQQTFPVLRWTCSSWVTVCRPL